MFSKWFLPVAVVAFASGCPNKDTAKPPGDLRHFEAVSALAAVRKFAGGADARLTELDGMYVRSDGTIDAYADYHPRIEYEFVLAGAPLESDKPIGAGGGGTRYQTVTVRIAKPGWSHVTTVHSEYTVRRKGMERSFGTASDSVLDDVVDDPRCTFTDIWNKAIDEGVTPDAVAHIEYEDGWGDAGPTWELRISDIDVKIELDADCEVTEAHVPAAEKGG